MANEQNLIPFEKGHKGIGGRPKGSISISATLRKLMEKNYVAKDPFTQTTEKKKIREWIALRLIAQAMQGNIKATKEILDRLEGKAIQITEITGRDGEPIPTSIKVEFVDSDGNNAKDT